MSSGKTIRDHRTGRSGKQSSYTRPFESRQDRGLREQNVRSERRIVKRDLDAGNWR